MRRTWAIIGMIASVAGILGLGITIGYFVGESRVVERVCVPDVKITALEFNGNRVTDFAHETKVPREVTVWGESEDLPNADESSEDLTIWVCVIPSNGRYYPQREPVDWQGRWQLDKVGVGTEGSRDAGKQFSICVVVAEKDASRILFDDATVYHRGLPRLPNGAIISDQIVVIREEEGQSP